MGSSISLPSFAAKTSNILNPDGTSIDQSFAPTNGGMFRNRIINGDMRIDQRATAISANGLYSVDRWRFIKSNDATESVAQNIDAPSGFSFSLRHTISVADAAIAAGQYSGLEHRIEGYNVSDLSFGTANAQSISIQFWVRGTKTGQYTGVASNSDFSRNCPFNFNINTTNTWESKTVTLPGCIDGTWNTTNGIGLILQFSIALGSTYTTGFTAGTWSTNTNCRGSGSPVNGLDSTANIFAITGVQLEKGSSATPFEFRPIGTELALCQRYYETGFCGVPFSYDTTTNGRGIEIGFKATKRSTPAITKTTGGGLLGGGFSIAGGAEGPTIDRFALFTSAAGAVRETQFTWTASAEL